MYGEGGDFLIMQCRLRIVTVYSLWPAELDALFPYFSFPLPCYLACNKYMSITHCCLAILRHSGTSVNKTNKDLCSRVSIDWERTGNKRLPASFIFPNLCLRNKQNRYLKRKKLSLFPPLPPQDLSQQP